MEIPGEDWLLESLRARQGDIAEAWRRAIAQTSFVPFSSAELTSRLSDLTGQAIALLFSEPFDTAAAEQIGTSLARLHYTQPEALGRTQSLLLRELLAGIAPDQVLAMLAQAGSLTEALAVGFGRETCGTLLREQEAIRQALLVNLRATEQQLREARDHLDEQVRDRTRELRESEEKYRELLEEIDAAVFTVDTEGRITYASPPVARLFGRGPAEVLGKSFAEYIHQPDLPLVQAAFAKVLAGQDARSEFRIPAGAGGLRWAHSATRPVFAGGQVVGAHGVITDITERKQTEEALRESEERWRALLDNSPDPVLTVDREGRVLFVNYVRPDSGLTLQDVLGQPAVDRALPDQMQAAMAALDRVFDAGESVVQEVAVRRPDGCVVWYACHVGPISQNDEVVAALAIARDVTQEKQVEAALQESEERWRTLVTHAPDLIYIVDSEGRMSLINRLPAESGLSPQDVEGRSILDYVLPEHQDRIRSALRQVFATGTSARYEAAVRRPDGTLVWYSSHLGPLRLGLGQPASAMLISRDVSERKRMESQLQESEERWRALVTHAPDIIFTLAPGGRILYVNHFPDDSRYDTAEVVGRQAHELVVGEDATAGREAIQDVFETGAVRRLELSVPTASGGPRWYSALIGPVWQDGAITAAVVIARDITERRRLEEMKDNLLRDVSHLLRTPLARAQISLEMALASTECSPVDRQGAIKFGRQALDNISGLASSVRAILDLSRLEAGVGAFAHETVDLHEVIAGAAAEAEPTISEKGLGFVVRLQDGLPHVRGDRERLWSVLHNLLDNAGKFASSGQIVLSAGVQGGEIVVSVRDDGCGILPENLERVFDRFFREDNATDGVGVGLAMCRTIIQAHGGRVWAESGGRGRGATLSFALPVPEQRN
ncbi:MAG TPA: PAS domain S-box protein [Anaerolineae bacterium]|nr:PAS domain S-box protein [Anaerolineae bacterium]